MATSRKTKPTIVHTIHEDQVHGAAPEVETPESFAAKFNWSYIIKGEASWKRWAVAMIAGLAATVAVGYVGVYFVTYTTLAAIMASSSMFISTLVYVLGVLITMYVGYRASAFTYIKVLDKTVDAKCAAAYNWATGLFGSSIKPQKA